MTLTTKLPKNIVCRPGNRQTMDAMRAAHDEGRHGDGTKADVVAYWAESCHDCHATWTYEHRPNAPFPRNTT